MDEASIGGEEAGKSNRRTRRGERGQRAWTDQPRNLGDPAERKENSDREDITCRGTGRESDRPIVAGKRVTTVERRGLSREVLL